MKRPPPISKKLHGKYIFMGFLAWVMGTAIGISVCITVGLILKSVGIGGQAVIPWVAVYFSFRIAQRIILETITGDFDKTGLD